MRLSFMIAAAVAIAAPLPAMAADWYRLTHTANFTDYADADSIRQDGQWTIVRVTTINTADDGKPKGSTSPELQFDCQANTLRIASFSAFGPDRALLGSIEWPENRKVQPVEKGSAFGNLAAFACDATRPGGIRVSDPYTDEVS